LTKVANQPAVVERIHPRISCREFGIALVAVIIVTLLLLPLRIAGVAGCNDPTYHFINAGCNVYAGIELDTVTLAALIMFLEL